MNPKLILGLALVLSGVLSGCSKPNEAASVQNSEPPGKLYEIHSLHGRPPVAIYMRGFVDSSFDAYLKEGTTYKLLFRSLPAMKSQFESVTNSIIRENHAHRIPGPNTGERMYDLFWSTNGQRFALAFQGNFVAAYDCQTGQKIQITDCRENKSQCAALGAVIGRFLDGDKVTDAEVAKIRRDSYSVQPESKP